MIRPVIKAPSISNDIALIRESLLDVVIEPQRQVLIPGFAAVKQAALAAGKPLFGAVVDGYWEDVGTLEAYLSSHKDVLDGKVRALHTLTGLELWSFNTAIPVTDVDGEAGNGGTIDSVGPIPAGNELYLNSGYGTFGNKNEWQAGYGNTLFVYRLKKGYSH